MDVVRATVERLGGRVSVSSRPATRHDRRFALPFTVMMTRVLTVEAGGQVFGVPMEAVVETFACRARTLCRSAPPSAVACATGRSRVIDLGQALGGREAVAPPKRRS